METVFNMAVEDYVENWESDPVTTSRYKRLHRLHTDKGVAENFGQTFSIGSSVHQAIGSSGDLKTA